MCSCFRTWNGDKNGNIRLNEMFKFKSYENFDLLLFKESHKNYYPYFRF
jgi:hypothetical protein